MCHSHIWLRLSQYQISLPVELSTLVGFWSTKSISSYVWIGFANWILHCNGVQEACLWNELGVVNGIVVEVWVEGEDACSQVVNGNGSMSNSVKILLGSSTSSPASIFDPVIVVGLNNVPFAVLGVEFVFVDSAEPGAANDNTFIIFSTSNSEITKSIDFLVL